MKLRVAVFAALTAILVTGCHHDPPVHNTVSTPSASAGQVRMPGFPTASPSGSQADVPGTSGYRP